MADRIEEDGGSAFPLADQPMPNDQWQYGSPGMPLRDWFAGQALAGIVGEHHESALGHWEQHAAHAAYAVADAMLSARQKGGA